LSLRKWVPSKNQSHVKIVSQPTLGVKSAASSPIPSMSPSRFPARFRAGPRTIRFNKECSSLFNRAILPLRGYGRQYIAATSTRLFSGARNPIPPVPPDREQVCTA
jgi:hypothetical protein